MGEIVEATPMPDPEPVDVGTLPMAPPTVADRRLAAYQARADGLFFKWQRGEATQQEWLDEVVAVRAEFPDTITE